MPADNPETYYWDIYTLTFESDDILALDDPELSFSDADTASIAQTIYAVLPFRYHSRLYVEIVLTDEGETLEERYAYI